MRTSLVCLLPALVMSWSVAFGAEPDSGPSTDFFRLETTVDLFDQITSSTAEESAAEHGPYPRHYRGLPFRSLLRARRDAEQQIVVRAQGLNGDGDAGQPDSRPVFPATPGMQSSPVAPYNPTYDPDPQAPFVRPGPVMPYLTPPTQPLPPAGSTWGTNGPQPYRMGSHAWGDIGWLSPSRVKQTGSKFEVMEINLGLTQTTATPWTPWLFALQHDFGYRSFDGPSGSPALHLPDNAYHFGWDMRLETPLNSPYSPYAMLLAFSPSINTDFDHSLTRNAINFDGRGILFFQADPTLLFALGAGYWDRVKDRVIPYVGVVWLPSSRWEWRLMFPQSRISYYAGNVAGEDYWLYLSGEYHVESYEVGRPGVVDRDQVELEDWRILFGARRSSQWGTGFIEGGWVFGRHTNFRTSPDFDVTSGFIGRIGLSY